MLIIPFQGLFFIFTFMLVNVYVVGKDCIDHLKVFIDHYRERFPGCVIYYFDNGSSDNSIEYVKEQGGIINHFPIYREDLLRNFKNNIWKSYPADWHIVCDVDELLYINSQDIAGLAEDVNIIRSEGWQVHHENLKLFYRSSWYNKSVMFKQSVKEINYSIGSHAVRPLNPVYSESSYRLKHLGFGENRMWTIYTKERKWGYIALYNDEVRKYVTGNEKLIEL